MRYLWLFFSLAIFCSCSSVKIEKDYDPKYNFSQLKYYTMTDADQANLDPKSLIGQRVQEAVHSQLQEKGYVLAREEKADFLVTLQYWKNKYIEATGPTVGLGVGIGMPAQRTGFAGLGLGHSAQLKKYDILAMSVFDAKTKKEVYQAQARGQLEDEDPKKTQEKLQTAVDKIIDSFESI